MSNKSILWSALVIAAVAVAGCEGVMTPDARQAPTTPPATATAPTGRGRGAAGAAPANLQNAMSEMNRMLTAIKNESTDPTKIDQTIKDISTFARDVAISKLQTPPNVNRMATPEEKAKAMESYRSMMNGLTRTLLDLEDAVNAKKPDDIKKALDQLGELEKAGHTEFQVKG